MSLVLSRKVNSEFIQTHTPFAAAAWRQAAEDWISEALLLPLQDSVRALNVHFEKAEISETAKERLKGALDEFTAQESQSSKNTSRKISFPKLAAFWKMDSSISGIVRLMNE